MNLGSYFSDADGDTLTYTASAADTGVAAVSLSGAIVSVTPVAAGATTITVTGSDGSLNATQTLMVTVNPRPNRAPIIEALIEAQTVVVGGSPATVSLGSYFSDPDGDALTYTATSSHSGAATTSVSGTTVTITPIAIGAAMITAMAADSSGLSVTQMFTVTVNPPPNRAPTAVGTIPTQTVTAGGTGTVNLGSYFSDADGDTLTYTATSSDTGVAAVNLSGAAMVITPIAVGTVTVTAIASDPEGASVTQTFTVTVNPATSSELVSSQSANNAPITVGTISTQTVTVGGSAGTVDVSSKFTHPDGDTLTYTVSLSNTAVATVSVSGTTVTITPVATGTTKVTVIAVDSDGLSAAQTFTVTVNPQPNQAPAVLGSIPTQTVTVGGSPATVNLESYFSDPDGDTMTYTVSLSNTGVAMASVSGTTVTITPVAAGTATVTAMATDSIGLSTAQTFTVTVNPQSNRSPIAVGSISTQTVTVGGSAVVNLGSYFSDPDGDTLTYTATSSHSGVATTSVSGTTVTITPIAIGAAIITARAVGFERVECNPDVYSHGEPTAEPCADSSGYNSHPNGDGRWYWHGESWELLQRRRWGYVDLHGDLL